jgi:integrase/recombinase XerD
VIDLPELLPSWELHLRAERKSPHTVESYGDGIRAYLGWCEREGRPAQIDRHQLREFTDSLLASGAKPATAVARHLAVRRFSAWLADEGEQDTDPLYGLSSPHLDEPVVEPLTDDQLRAMIRACRGPDMRDRRDEALLRLMFTTGIRAGEAIALQLGDVDLRGNPPTVIIRRGKGGKGRMIPVAVEAAAAIDRYIRARKAHRLAGDPALWLGDRGKRFAYDALHKTLAMRANIAGVPDFHPHRLRHTAADRWLAKGGSELGLMAIAGWGKPDMLLRYTKRRASVRAAEEAQLLNLGEL